MAYWAWIFLRLRVQSFSSLKALSRYPKVWSASDTSYEFGPDCRRLLALAELPQLDAAGVLRTVSRHRSKVCSVNSSPLKTTFSLSRDQPLALWQGWGVGLRRRSRGGAQRVYARQCSGKRACEIPIHAGQAGLAKTIRNRCDVFAFDIRQQATDTGFGMLIGSLIMEGLDKGLHKGGKTREDLLENRWCH